MWSKKGVCAKWTALLLAGFPIPMPSMMIRSSGPGRPGKEGCFLSDRFTVMADIVA